MPLVQVTVFERRLLEDPGFAERLAKAIDATVTEVVGGDTRPDTWVIVDGVPDTRWTFNGETRTRADSD